MPGEQIATNADVSGGSLSVNVPAYLLLWAILMLVSATVPISGLTPTGASQRWGGGRLPLWRSHLLLTPSPVTVFQDDDGSNAQNGSESAIENIGVSIYEDLNNNGVIDGSESAIATTNTDSNGNYSFTVADGNYLVEVDSADPDLGGGSYGGVTGTANDPAQQSPQCGCSWSKCYHRTWIFPSTRYLGGVCPQMPVK